MLIKKTKIWIIFFLKIKNLTWLSEMRYISKFSMQKAYKNRWENRDLWNDADQCNWWFNSVTWYANSLQISSQWVENGGFRNFSLVVDLWPLLTLVVDVGLKMNGGWMQILFNFQVNQMKNDELEIWPQNDLWSQNQ